MKQPPMPTKVQAEILQKLVDGWLWGFSIERSFAFLFREAARYHHYVVEKQDRDCVMARGWVRVNGDLTDAGREALARYRQKEARRANKTTG